MLQGIIFDLDNTLVDSRLDFDAMREEMGLASDLRILEAIAELPAEHAAQCHAILAKHESEGARRATLLPGVAELLEEIERRKWRLGIVTRNSRHNAHATLENVGLRPHVLVTRDDGPIKPDPWPVAKVCKDWGIEPHVAVMIGDYRFDVDSGRAAGTHTVLLSHPVAPHEYPNEEGADLVLSSLAEWKELLAWLDTLCVRQG